MVRTPFRRRNKGLIPRLAHQQAYELGILHRDISAGNILMTLQPENRRGFLIDWDHCIFLNDALKKRTGTRVQRTVSDNCRPCRSNSMLRRVHGSLCLHI